MAVSSSVISSSPAPAIVSASRSDWRAAERAESAPRSSPLSSAVRARSKSAAAATLRMLASAERLFPCDTVTASTIIGTSSAVSTAARMISRVRRPLAGLGGVNTTVGRTRGSRSITAGAAWSAAAGAGDARGLGVALPPRSGRTLRSRSRTPLAPPRVSAATRPATPAAGAVSSRQSPPSSGEASKEVSAASAEKRALSDCAANSPDAGKTCTAAEGSATSVAEAIGGV